MWHYMHCNPEVCVQHTERKMILLWLKAGKSTMVVEKKTELQTGLII